MPKPIYTLPVTGTAPNQVASRQAHEAAIQSVIDQLWGLSDAGVIDAAEDIADSVDAAEAAAAAAAAYDPTLRFPTVAALLASTRAAGGAGAVWQAEGFEYVEAASGASNHDLTTAGGVKLYVQPGAFGFDITAFGAVRGVPGEATLVQCVHKARDAIASRFPNGHTIYFPAGDWHFADTALITVGGIELCGAGKGTRIINATTDKAAIRIGALSAGSTIWRTAARSMVFGAKSGVVSVSGSLGLLCQYASDVRLEAIEVYPFPAALHRGVAVSICYQPIIDRVKVTGCLDVGQTYFDIVDATFYAAEASANDVGFTFEACEGFWGQNVNGYRNTVNAFWFKDSAIGLRPNKNFFMTSWVGDTSGSHNWRIDNLSTAYFNGCWGATQLNPAVNTFACGFFMQSNKVFNLQFNGGSAGNNNSHGVSIFDNGTPPRQITFNGFDFGADEAQFASNGRSGAGLGMFASPTVTGVRVYGGRNVGNPSGPFSPTGIDIKFLSNIGSGAYVPLQIELGGTAAATPAQARINLAVPAEPNLTPGNAGYSPVLYAAVNTAMALPAGGTWKWVLFRRSTISGGINAIQGGVDAGGTTISVGAANQDMFANVWRIR